MDEASKQLLRDVEPSQPMKPGEPKREDYHYERRGTQSIFCFFDPHRGWRRVTTRDSRTRVDFAEEVRHLLDGEYPQAKKVRLVCDNLNTHGIASLYEAFPPAEAHRLARRLEFHHTPRNGSWLNVAEIELSVLARQCLHRRIGSEQDLRKEVEAWTEDRNRTHAKVVWHLTTPDARIRLKKLYPQF